MAPSRGGAGAARLLSEGVRAHAPGRSDLREHAPAAGISRQTGARRRRQRGAQSARDGPGLRSWRAVGAPGAGLRLAGGSAAGPPNVATPVAGKRSHRRRRRRANAAAIRPPAEANTRTHCLAPWSTNSCIGRCFLREGLLPIRPDRSPEKAFGTDDLAATRSFSDAHSGGGAPPESVPVKHKKASVCGEFDRAHFQLDHLCQGFAADPRWGRTRGVRHEHAGGIAGGLD